DRHRDGRGLRRPLLAVHPARARARAGCRRHHRADEPGRVSRPPRAHGAGGADAGALVPRLGARARRECGLQDGADRQRHRTAERPALAASGPVPRARLGDDRADSIAVADSSTIHLDRRLTVGDTLESAVAEIAALESVKRAEATVTVLDYARPSYTGLVYPTKKYYPTWTVEESHPAVAAAVSAGEFVLGRRPAVGKWTFSTNGVATCGLFRVPTVGFGPGHEIYAHSPEDQCPVDHLTQAAAFYAAFPSAFVRTNGSRR